jgi:hypothetical protein
MLSTPHVNYNKAVTPKKYVKVFIPLMVVAGRKCCHAPVTKLNTTLVYVTPPSVYPSLPHLSSHYNTASIIV